ILHSGESDAACMEGIGGETGRSDFESGSGWESVDRTRSKSGTTRTAAAGDAERDGGGKEERDLCRVLREGVEDGSQPVLGQETERRGLGSDRRDVSETSAGRPFEVGIRGAGQSDA